MMEKIMLVNELTNKEMPLELLTTTRDGFFVSSDVYAATLMKLKQSSCTLQEIKDRMKLEKKLRLELYRLIVCAKELSLVLGKKFSEIWEELMTFEKTMCLLNYNKDATVITLEENLEMIQEVMSTFDLDYERVPTELRQKPDVDSNKVREDYLATKYHSI